ncbi:hypothetical protein EV702DRAFT_1192199 [Suillus placidus]|uniref:Uncharacterized protein n=1 Tax=Suillus placidus TaxID=48579 RepID=A0A9P7A6E9_9AGAM|nr:hypothetical protein EV702DRAFT_1192199 [Suillus placidus]
MLPGQCPPNTNISQIAAPVTTAPPPIAPTVITSPITTSLAAPPLSQDLQKHDPTYIIAEYGTKTATGILCNHVLKFYLRVYITELEKHKLKIGAKEVQDLVDCGWTLAQMSKELNQNPELTLTLFAPVDDIPDFTIDEMHQQLIKFVVVDDQAMNLMECPEFWQLLQLLRKDLRKSDIPHRTKLCELIIETWYEYFEVLKQDLAKAEGKILFTSDLWSDNNRRLFLALTAHWIAQQERTSKLVLKAALIAFTHVPGSHDAVSLAAIILELGLDPPKAEFEMRDALVAENGEHVVKTAARGRGIVTSGPDIPPLQLSDQTKQYGVPTKLKLSPDA